MPKLMVEKPRRERMSGRHMQKFKIFRSLALPAGLIVTSAALPFIISTYYEASLVLIFAIAAMALNLLWEHAGLLSFGQGIFFGIGAYGAAWVIAHFHWGLILSLLTGVILGGAGAAVVGYLSVRRRGVYFVLLTFAFAEMFGFLVYAIPQVTGGENGILGIPRRPISLFGHDLVNYSGQVALYSVIGILFIASGSFLWIIIRSPFGASLRAVRDNEDRARAAGYDPVRLKVLAFTISGALTGLSGVLYTLLLQSVPPSVMQLQQSTNFLVMTIVGGVGSIYGAVLGAFGITILGDELSSVWARWRIVSGIVLVIIALFVRGGVWGGLAWLVRRVTDRLRDMRRHE